MAFERKLSFQRGTVVCELHTVLLTYFTWSLIQTKGRCFAYSKPCNPLCISDEIDRKSFARNAVLLFFDLMGLLVRYTRRESCHFGWKSFTITAEIIDLEPCAINPHSYTLIMKSFHNVKSQGLLKKYEEKQTKFEERWEDISRSSSNLPRHLRDWQPRKAGWPECRAGPWLECRWVWGSVPTGHPMFPLQQMTTRNRRRVRLMSHYF